MKKALTIAIAALGIGFSSLSVADRDWDRHHGYDRYHHHDQRYRAPHGHKHWKKHHRVYDHRPQVRYYAPPRHHTTVVHYHDDDLYKWVGGMYILNEILHHDHR